MRIYENDSRFLFLYTATIFVIDPLGTTNCNLCGFSVCRSTFRSFYNYLIINRRFCHRFKVVTLIRSSSLFFAGSATWAATACGGRGWGQTDNRQRRQQRPGGRSDGRAGGEPAGSEPGERRFRVRFIREVTMRRGNVNDGHKASIVQKYK